MTNDNPWWIIMKYGTGVIGARMSDAEPPACTVYWNEMKPRHRLLQRAYTYTEIVQMHPQQLQHEIMEMAGMEAGNISGVGVHSGDLVWEDEWKGIRG